MPRFNAGIGEGAQHLELVVVADFLNLREGFAAEFEGFAVKIQHRGLQIIKFFDHVSVIPSSFVGMRYCRQTSWCTKPCRS